MPEPQHHDGEPCELPISRYSRELAAGLKFEYATDEKGRRVRRAPQVGDWFVGVTYGEKITLAVIDFFPNLDFTILRAIPIGKGEA